MTITDPGDLRFHGFYQFGFTPDGMLPSDSAGLPTEVHGDSERPDTPRPALVALREACELPDDLFGGNRRVRQRSDRWLPREEAESDRAYRVRVARSTLFPFYRETVCELAARPFGQDLTWEQEPPPTFSEFLADVDGSGKTLAVFARDMLLNAIHRGMDHVLVDVAAEGTGETARGTQARRVYAHRIDALSLLDVREQVDETGRRHVVYCRFVTTRDVRSDSWQQETEPVIVELEKGIRTRGAPDPGPGRRVEWTFDRKAKTWQSSGDLPYEPGNRGIPLLTLYTQQLGPYASEPALEDLAWVNLAHYQSRADHAHVMRIARLITLVTLGWKRADKTDPQAKGADKIVLGPLSRIQNEKGPSDAAAFFLEPSGKSIELSFRDMEQLAEECERLGARHAMTKTGNVTARAVTLDDAKSATNLQSWCVRLEVVLRQIVEAVANWLNAPDLPDDVAPRLFKDFQVTGNIEGGARALAAIKDHLSTRQVTTEAKRYGILRPDFPIDANLEELEEARAAIETAIAQAAGGGDDSEGDQPDDGPEEDAPGRAQDGPGGRGEVDDTEDE